LRPGLGGYSLQSAQVVRQVVLRRNVSGRGVSLTARLYLIVTLRVFVKALGKLAQRRRRLRIQCASGLDQALLRRFQICLPRFHVISTCCQGLHSVNAPRAGWLPVNHIKISPSVPEQRSGLSQMWNLCFLRDLSRHHAHQEVSMGSTADKVTGMTNEAVGKIKQDVGKAVGSDKLRVEGVGQEAKGDAQKAMGDAKAAAKDAANKTADFVNKKL
jgi:uncharacterized protein YjbJ (UPF0337 family)